MTFQPPQAFIKPSDFIETQSKEAVKMYIVYDGSARMETTYTAAPNAVTGSKCIRTDYAYDGSSTRVVKMRESVDVWDSSYDI